MLMVAVVSVCGFVIELFSAVTSSPVRMFFNVAV